MGPANGDQSNAGTDPRVLPMESPEPTSSLLDIVRRRKWVLVACVVVAAALGLLQAAKGIPLYEAESRVLLWHLDGMNAPRGEAVSVVAPSEVVNNHIVLLKGADVLNLAVKNGKLDEIAGFSEAAKHGVLVDELSKGLKAQREPDKHVISVAYRHPNPEVAARVVNAVVDAFSQYVAEHQRDTKLEILKMLTAEKNQIESKIREKNNELKALHRTCELHALEDDESPNSLSTSVALREMHATARVREVEDKAKFEMISKAAAKGSDADALLLAEALGWSSWSGQAEEGIDMADEQRRESQAMRIRKLQLQRQRLLERVGPKHPEVLRIEDELKVLGMDALADAPEPRWDAAASRPGEQQRLGLSGRLVSMFKRRYELSKAVSARLADELQKERGKAIDGSNARLQLRSANSDMADLQEWRSTNLSKISSLDLNTNNPRLKIQVVKRAKQPTAPVGSGSGRTMVLSLLVGVVVGFGLMLFLDRTDRSFRSPDDVKAALRLPVLGNIPSFRNETLVGENELAITVHLRPKSVEAEAFRALRTVIGYAAQRRNLRTFLITSPNPHDGKTTLVCNLATAMANLGARVLVVDGDLRHRQIHRVFKVGNARGLTEYLTGTDDSWRAYVSASGIRNLHVLAAGRRPDNPAELLGSPKFTHLLDKLKRAYDYVIVDSAPTLLVTDASIIASQVDATLLVIKIAKNEKPTAVVAKDALTAVNAKLLGVVLNDVSSGSRYGYAYYHRYQYHYGRGYRRYPYTAEEKTNTKARSA